MGAPWGRGVKSDALAWAAGRPTAKRPSKETLNHAGLIRLASGLDPLRETAAAYRLAYERLGIDIVNRVPLENAPAPLEPGRVVDLGDGYRASPLGLYDTLCRHVYPYRDAEEFFAAAARGLDLDYTALRTPVPHPLSAADMAGRSAGLGEAGLYYCMLYTTLFMWGVEYLGWEVFMTAAMQDPAGFDELFLAPAAAASRRLVGELAAADSPLVFVHDDLADGRGPVFPPAWYERWIFPRYPAIFEPAKAAGKKLVLVADGNMAAIFEPLKAAGVDGVMFENPATDFDAILSAFADGLIVGGFDTRLLSFATPAEIRRAAAELASKTAGLAGFALSSPGGIHGNIPIENLEAYFDARVKAGFTPEGWRAAG